MVVINLNAKAKAFGMALMITAVSMVILRVYAILIDLDISSQITILFLLHLFFSTRLVFAEAAAAYDHARKGGHVEESRISAPIRGEVHYLRVRKDCPDRWLVCLHIEDTIGGVDA